MSLLKRLFKNVNEMKFMELIFLNMLGKPSKKKKKKKYSKIVLQSVTMCNLEFGDLMKRDVFIYMMFAP